MSAGLQAHYQQQVTAICTCLRVILTKRQPRIVDITRADPGVFTTLWDHNYEDGQIIRPLYVRGMTEVNEQFYRVTVAGARSFSIDADTSSFGVFQKGAYGVAQKVLGFTNHIDPLEIDGVVYAPHTGADGSALATSADLAVNHLELTGLILDSGFKRKDLLDGVYHYAEFQFFEVHYADLSLGKLILPTGNFGEITVMENKFKVELLGLIDKLYQETGKLVSIACPAELGDKITEPLDDRFGCKVRLVAAEWQPETDYGVAATPHDAALGALVQPTVYIGRYFKCTQAGTSGASEPAWDSAVGAVTVDGTVEWTCIDSWTKYSEITGVADRRTFADSARTEPNGWFDFGLVTLLSGDNAGFAAEVKSHLRSSYAILAVNTGAKTFEVVGNQTAHFLAGDLFPVIESTFNDGDYTVVSASYSSGPNRTAVTVDEAIPSAVADGHIEWRPGIFILRDKAFNDIEIGDDYEVQAGCDKFAETCIAKFDNIYNFRGHPYVPGFHLANTYPDAP
jgi:hypothetical protein